MHRGRHRLLPPQAMQTLHNLRLLRLVLMRIQLLQLQPQLSQQIGSGRPSLESAQASSRGVSTCRPDRSDRLTNPLTRSQ